MASQNALKDENGVASALFENASVAGETKRGKIDASTGRILVDATSGVVGPVSSTDNAVARWDGATGLVIQNSVVVVGDTGNVTGVGSIDATSYKVGGVVGTSGSFTTVDLKTVTVVNGLITVIA